MTEPDDLGRFADPAKFGRTDLAPVCPLREIDLLITTETDSPVLAQLRERGLQITVAD